MVLEATIICIDNSDWCRNGDYMPNRFQAQISAANFIIENRCETNPENSLGIMTMAGKRVEMVSTLTNDESRLLGSMSSIPLNGECDIISALSISILCLKHRINKNQKQRIILFVGSPVTAKPENLVQIGKKLKKYNVAVDIISFGNVEENRESLNIFLNEVNNSNNSSMLEVPLGGYIMESLFSSSIMGGGDAAFNQVDAGAQGAGANPQNMGGVSQFERDMNLALQMSLQEANKDQPSNQTNINAAAEENKTTIKGTRAYLKGKTADARIAEFSIGESETTGISTIATQKADNAAYDMQGRRVETLKKGVYVVNGKKVVVK